MEDMPTFTKYVGHTQPLSVDAYCSSLHAKNGLWEDWESASYEKGQKVHVNDFPHTFNMWLSDHGIKDKWIPGGKNFSGFDGLFLHAMGVKTFRHRSIDLSTIYALPEDTVPPSLEECKRRASAASGVDFSVTHRALDDTIDFVKCLRTYFNDDSVRKWQESLRS